MTYEQLKSFCNSLTPEQLKQEAHLTIVDSKAIKIISALVTKEDEYFDHGDSMGHLDDVKEDNPDDWEEVILNASICPKGTVFLLNE